MVDFLFLKVLFLKALCSTQEAPDHSSTVLSIFKVTCLLALGHDHLILLFIEQTLKDFIFVPILVS